MYTEFKYDPEFVKAQKEQFLTNLENNKGGRNIVGFASQMLADWLQKNPQRYRDFGPYWWAFKKILIARGLAKGETMDEAIAAEYRGADDEETVVLCQLFMDEYRAKSLIGANRFQLDPEEPGDYILYDPDYEVSAE